MGLAAWEFLLKLCECGCGQPTAIAKANHSVKGHIKGQPVRFVTGHQNRWRKWSADHREKFVAAAKGHAVSAETRLKLSESMKRIGHRPPDWAVAKSNENRPTGAENPSWKGGIIYANGRRCVYFPDHPRAHANGYVYEHVLIAGETEGRIIEPFEVVHHIDGDKTNNDPSNLQVLSGHAEHLALHRAQGDI